MDIADEGKEIVVFVAENEFVPVFGGDSEKI